MQILISFCKVLVLQLFIIVENGSFKNVSRNIKTFIFKLFYVTQVHSCNDVNNVDVVQPTRIDV